MGPQHGLDLAQLDAEAADLHLIVEAAEKLDGAIGALPSAVAGPVQPPARATAERISDELLRRQRRPTEITAGHAVAADDDFPGNADGSGVRSWATTYSCVFASG